jgi:hypothetical protein
MVQAVRPDLDVVAYFVDEVNFQKGFPSSEAPDHARLWRWLQKKEVDGFSSKFNRHAATCVLVAYVAVLAGKIASLRDHEEDGLRVLKLIRRGP